MSRTRLTITLAAAAALALGACSKDADPQDDASTGVQAEQGIEPGAQSVPAALAEAEGMTTVAGALKDTGVRSVLEGKGSYTLLAPGNEAFARLGEAGKSLTGAQDHAALAALLKAHLMPGYVTPRDIGAAIDASKDGRVTMATLGGEELTFTRAGEAITVTAPDGAKASLSGTPVAGGGSIALPVTGVLRKL